LIQTGYKNSAVWEANITEVPKIKRGTKAAHKGWSQTADQALQHAATFGPDFFMIALLAVCTLGAVAMGGGWAAVVAGVSFLAAYFIWQERQTRQKFYQKYKLDQLHLENMGERIVKATILPSEKEELDIFEQGIILDNKTGRKKRDV
jgi:hypothetical protein